MRWTAWRRRCAATQARSKRIAGHLFNWYDTITGQALEPRYVSSVDSGNLAGSLIAVANGCDALLRDGLAASRASPASPMRCCCCARR